ncbi:MAG: hypothetical protein P5702_03055 [Limnospira sp. PMC 1291.21]|uniref:Uncharacterized protein n=3 Tax=Limnospira TaxID=2596745 RepID=A0A9P1KF81_9CYAN|nr:MULTISPECIES: hypothetical protein [Limnospira]EKD07014.1 hypothetical protein SPLC1_S511280 [Arthrospira platensis C1]MBD2712538.1 hypothetical protein [Arthrospira platensis FACHB-835]MDC0838148.1 hypothetical protein [Limnoraphis robusta]MDY7053333.1 hypothetical protein [Limnospira fusiformis LS22]QJB26251.1 hypothetical protein HFV01_11135 [Limnospira fusiformis SAG 85.79]RAQ45329.1 hypothetical protein B9S53_07705 [Arthrospira sp. O9.13F]
MAQTLITSGIINPRQWPLARVWLEVATYLGVPPRQIDRLEFWTHQIWVKLLGMRATLVSFRVLPLWVEQGIAAIRETRDRDRLDLLGEIFSTEISRYSKHYNSPKIEAWRSAWAEQSQKLKQQELIRIQEEENLSPLREHQQACQQWLEGWRVILKHCQSLESLDNLAPEIERQMPEFSDLEEAATAMEIWSDRRQEVAQITDGIP